MIDKKDIAKNTIDVSVDIYPSAHQVNFRHRVILSPDFPETVDILYQELEDGVYITKESIRNITKESIKSLAYALEITATMSV